jgi:hypothetical protein
MSEDFDPYYKWLGIPPEEQPPNHYCLLGLRVFEADPDVIEHAADRQMTHVRTFQTGKYSAQSQRLLNEISQVKIVLLNDEKKRSYDATLRGAHTQTKSLPPLRAAVPPRSSPTGAGPAKPDVAYSFASSRASSQAAARRSAAGWQSVKLFVGAMVAVLFVGGVFLMIGLGEAEPKKPSSARQRTAGPQDEKEKLRGPAIVKVAPALSRTNVEDPKQPEPPVVPERLAFSFDNDEFASRYWEWNDEWTFAMDGGHAPRGPQSYLRSKHEFLGDLSINMEFGLGQAKFSNTGGCWITLWDQRLLISNHWRQLNAKVDIRREGDELIYDLNGTETRIVIPAEYASQPTTIEVRWRSRTSHFRRIEIVADKKNSKAPEASKS